MCRPPRGPGSDVSNCQTDIVVVINFHRPLPPSISTVHLVTLGRRKTSLLSSTSTVYLVTLGARMTSLLSTTFIIHLVTLGRGKTPLPSPTSIVQLVTLGAGNDVVIFGAGNDVSVGIHFHRPLCDTWCPSTDFDVISFQHPLGDTCQMAQGRRFLCCSRRWMLKDPFFSAEITTH